MPRGRFPLHLARQPSVDVTPERAYAEMDGFTFEIFPDEETAWGDVDLVMVLPPVSFEGRFVKGLCFSQGVEVLREHFPSLFESCLVIANSMTCSYPRSTRADACFALYDNPRREAWFRARHPERAWQPLLPLQSADFTNEYLIAPRPVAGRDIDVLCVAQLYGIKNLPLLARALRVYEGKYGRRLRAACIVGKPFEPDGSGLNRLEQRELQLLRRELDPLEDYLELVPRVEHYQMPLWYTRSRALVLPSVLEGKNRAVHEALSCDVPVAVFRQFNEHARGARPVFPEECGVTPEFGDEPLADAIHQLLTERGRFRPRLGYLRHFGRKNFLKACLDRLPYYRQALPEYAPDPWSNVWLDAAVQWNYGVSLLDFLYDRQHQFARVRGLAAIQRTVGFLERKFAGSPASARVA